MATYTEHQQRMLDQNSLDPDSNWEAAAYKKLVSTPPSAGKLARVLDVQYYLTRLEGQLLRLNTLTAPNVGDVWDVKSVRGTIASAQAFAQSLRNALDENRIDVA